MKKAAIICDIDGTIAEKGERHPFNYDDVDKDTPKPAITVVRALQYSGWVKIILISGREDSCREKTIQWLGFHDVVFDELYMRKTGDHRKDSIVKKEIYDREIKRKYDVKFVLDDRNQVVDMWRKELNIPCFQVDYGDF